MEITFINKKNIRYFKHLYPDVNMTTPDIALGAISDGVAAGVLLADMESSKFVIRWLYVDMDEWGSGTATMLLDHLGLLARHLNISCTTATYKVDDDNWELDRFLEDYGFILLPEDGRYYKTKLSDFKEFKDRMAPVIRAKSDACTMIPLSKARDYHWMRLKEEVNNRDDKLVRADFILERDRYDQDLSFIKLNGNEPTGCILLEKTGNDYIVSYCCNLNRKNPVETGILLFSAIENIARRLKKNVYIYMNAINKASESLVLKTTNNRAKLVDVIKTRYLIY